MHEPAAEGLVTGEAPGAIGTRYRRSLPLAHIPFSSAEGRTIFREALAAGTMEGYFSLAEQFHTQGEPSFCGLGTLVLVLNALSIDPGRTWKGSWRWFAEDMLDCCRSLDDVRVSGITLSEFVCLARCNGAHAEMRRPAGSSLEVFRGEVREAASCPGDVHLVAAYDRAALGQSGAGHFSPIGGYHAARDLVLMLDVARFKYPPHWVSLEALWAAFLPHDSATGKSRGYVRLTRGGTPAILCSLASEKSGWNDALDALVRARPASALGASKGLFDGVAPSAIAAMTMLKPLIDGDAYQAPRQELLAQIGSTPLFRALSPSAPPHVSTEIVTLLLLAAPDAVFAALPPAVRDELGPLRAASDVPDMLRAEIDALRVQLQALSAYCREG